MSYHLPLRLLMPLVASLLTLWVTPSAAHVDLTDPPMRGGDQKAGPCEGEERGEAMTFEAGSTVTMSWTETVDHPGAFIISFDPDGDDFDGDGDGNDDFPASMSGADEASGAGDLVLLEIPDEGGSDHTAEVTLPNMACEDCTLQLIQNMGERQPSGMNPTAHLYFRCADIVLTGGGGGEGGGGGMAGAAGSAGMAGGGGMMMGGGGSMMGGAGGVMMGLAGAEPGGSAGMPVIPMGGMAMMPTPMPMPDPVVTPPAMTTAAPTVNPPVAGGAGAANDTPPPSGPGPTATPSATPSSTADAMTSDEAGEEGGCFGRVSPVDSGGHAGWALMLLTLFGWRRRRRGTA